LFTAIEIIPVVVRTLKAAIRAIQRYSKATQTIKDTRAHKATIKHSASAFRNNGGAC
jgi:hypothetical protein